MNKVNIFWFRRDLRIEDNHGLYKALESGHPVQAIFIFDPEILDELDKNDARVSFIYNRLETINDKLKEVKSSLLVKHGNVIEVWKSITDEFDVQEVFTNEDYEPYAIQRDKKVQKLLESKEIPFNPYKDQVIFAKEEVVKDDGDPYTVYTPYMKKWMEKLSDKDLKSFPSEKNIDNFYPSEHKFPELADIGFEYSKVEVPSYNVNEDILKEYDKKRDIPSANGTTQVSPHLRFGSISVRKLARVAKKHSLSYFKELVWREFFMQILYHFPRVIDESFKQKYDKLKWRNNKEEFEKWCSGNTGYPIVDAGMRELNETGYMHNRVRMVTASFLCKHLLIDWRWGEGYFAKKLLDYELSSNNGNWQWAAGTGCDAAPYFRIFNPYTQAKKFDKDNKYINKWVPELESENYPDPIVEHKFARERALDRYKEALADN